MSVFIYGMGGRRAPSLNWKASILKTLPTLGAPPKGGRQAQVLFSLSTDKQPDSSTPRTLNKPGPRKWLFLVNPHWQSK